VAAGERAAAELPPGRELAGAAAGGGGGLKFKLSNIMIFSVDKNHWLLGIDLLQIAASHQANVHIVAIQP
jgi:hypothetical protein